MSRFQHTRDNVLSTDEKAASARKCIALLSQVEPSDMTNGEWGFFCGQLARSRNVRYDPSEPTLQRLRDMVSKYVTS